MSIHIPVTMATLKRAFAASAFLMCLLANAQEPGHWKLSGLVLLDNGAGGGQAHDGVQNGSEYGMAGVRVHLTDCSGGEIAKALSDATGNFRMQLSSAQSSQWVCLESETQPKIRRVSVHPGNTGGHLDERNASIKFEWRDGAKYVGLVLGNMPLSTLSGKSRGTAAPGERMRYLSTYQAGSAARLKFSVSKYGSDVALAWPVIWYVDNGCILSEADELPATVNTSLDVEAGQTVCLHVELRVATDAPPKERHNLRVLARETWRLPTLFRKVQWKTITNLFIVTVHGGGAQLLLEQRKVNACPANAAASLQNTAVFGLTEPVPPGAAVEYRLSYQNTSATALNQLLIASPLPAHTRFVDAMCLHTPQSGLRGCELAMQPLPNAAVGQLHWRLLDAEGALAGLQPGDSGSVAFCVYVQD